MRREGLMSRRILDGQVNGPELRNMPVCRFNFHKFPMDQTRFVLGTHKDLTQDIIEK